MNPIDNAKDFKAQDKTIRNERMHLLTVERVILGTIFTLLVLASFLTIVWMTL